jgi:hypothetical protein
LISGSPVRDDAGLSRRDLQATLYTRAASSNAEEHAMKPQCLQPSFLLPLTVLFACQGKTAIAPRGAAEAGVQPDVPGLRGDAGSSTPPVEAGIHADVPGLRVDTGGSAQHGAEAGVQTDVAGLRADANGSSQPVEAGGERDVAGLRGDAGGRAGEDAGKDTGLRPAKCEPSFKLGGLTGNETGETPIAVVAGDFNADGKLDLATANQDGNSVSVLFGRGNGTFLAKVDYQAGTGPSAIVAGDWNGDGKLDLAATNQASASIAVFLNRGDGTFARQADVAVGPGLVALQAGDLDDDSLADLAVANRDGDSVSVVFGKGDGTFSSKVDYPAGRLPQSIAAGDFNRDGRKDLAVGNDTDPPTLTILLGKAGRAFEQKPPRSLDGFVGLTSMRAGDLDGDGNLDLVLQVNPGTDSRGGIPDHLDVLLGAGDGTFPAQVDCPDLDTVAVEVVDLRGQGRMDIAFLRPERSSLTVVLDPAGGDLGAAVDYPFLGGDAMTFGDFTGDGKQDVAVLSKYGNSVGVGVGADGTFQASGTYPLSGGGFTFLRDMNHDGHLDAVVVGTGNDGATNLRVREGKGDGTFVDSPAGDDVIGANGKGIDSVAIGDVDGDGNLDVLILDAFDTVKIASGDGTGGFALTSQFVAGKDAGDLALGDLDGDGKADLALRLRNNHSVAVWLGNGKGMFTPKTEIPVPYDPESREIYLPPFFGDVNGDKILDMVVLFETTFVVALGKGDGTFGNIATHASSAPRSSLYQALLADLNGDNASDLVLVQSQAVYVLLARGDGTFASAVEYPIFGLYGQPEREVTLDDLDGDGQPDLAVLGENGKLAVLLGNGDGSFACQQLYSAANGCATALGDLNGDGRPDAVFVDCYSGQMSVAINTPL